MIKRILKLLVSSIYYLFLVCNRWIQHLIGYSNVAKCYVLYCHSVNSDQREKFATQLDNLLKWSEPISIFDREKLTEKKNYIAITFDDGFDCVAANAVPELLKRNINATIFVPTGYLGREPGWPDQGCAYSKNEQVMTADQIKLLAKQGITIGSHTVSHAFLTNLGIKEAEAELRNSKNDLEKILGNQITAFSYPYGEFNDELNSLAYQMGYEYIFNSKPTSTSLDPKKINGRVPMSVDDWTLEYWLKVNGAYDWNHIFAQFRKVYSLLIQNILNIFKR